MSTDTIPTEVMQIIRAGLAGDTERVRKYVAHWHNNLAQSGDHRSAERLRRELTGEPPARFATLDASPPTG